MVNIKHENIMSKPYYFIISKLSVYEMALETNEILKRISKKLTINKSKIFSSYRSASL